MTVCFGAGVCAGVFLCDSEVLTAEQLRAGGRRVLNRVRLGPAGEVTEADPGLPGGADKNCKN